MEDLEIVRSKYPRVSEIIAKQNESELRNIPIQNLVNASIRGTAIHNYCTMYMKNLWIDDVDAAYEPYFEAYKKWHSVNVKKILYSAIRLYDDKNLFSGEFDVIAELKNGKTFLIDIKTSATKSKSWPIQLAAYHHLCNLNGFEIENIMILHLKAAENAKYDKDDQGKKILVAPPVVKAKVIEYENIENYWQIFESALRCYDYFERKEKK